MGNVSEVTCRRFACIMNKSKFNEYFIKNYNEDSDIGYVLKADVQYPEKSHEFQ